MDYTYNSEDDPNKYYYRSDHYNFAKNGIPAIFYFNGTHEGYHRTTDDVEKINFDAMENVGKLIFHTLFELVNLITRAGRVAADACTLAGVQPDAVAGALVIFCAGCMLAVREHLDQVVHGLREQLGGAPFLGCFTFGEQGCFIGGENRHGNLMISLTVFAKD